MKSRTTAQFRKQLSSLPSHVQKQARRAYQQFRNNPWHRHSSLRFKQVHPNLPIYSVCITKSYRTVGKRDNKGMLWFWIGSHDDYDKLLRGQ